METNPDKFDDVQFAANETLRQYVKIGQASVASCYDYMAKLGALFIPEDKNGTDK